MTRRLKKTAQLRWYIISSWTYFSWAWVGTTRYQGPRKRSCASMIFDSCTWTCSSRSLLKYLSSLSNEHGHHQILGDDNADEPTRKLNFSSQVGARPHFTTAVLARWLPSLSFTKGSLQEPLRCMGSLQEPLRCMARRPLASTTRINSFIGVTCRMFSSSLLTLTLLTRSLPAHDSERERWEEEGVSLRLSVVAQFCFQTMHAWDDGDVAHRHIY